MQINLTGKRILVTGSTRGIGKAIGEALQNSGATVAFHGNNGKMPEKRNGNNSNGKAYFFQSDLSKSSNVITLFDRVIEKLGGLDVLVNNAGIALGSAVDNDETNWIRQWEDTMAVNLTAAAILCKKAIPVFKNGQGGTIINISSRAAFRGDTAEYLAYAASKGGLVSLTRSIARAWGKDNIVAYNVAPGFVRTDMATQFFDQYGEDFGLNDLALNKLTEPEDIAPMVVLLASGLAKHATGATIDINGGSYVH